jgi:acetylornithine deacetylase/succinyl-diaminopimelate desuccinylase-like protein
MLVGGEYTQHRSGCPDILGLLIQYQPGPSMSATFPPSDLTAWVDTEAARLTAEWQECCRIPSVSADNAPALERMADWLEQRAAPLFDDFRRLANPAGPPVLLGSLRGAGYGRLLVYSHYDVVPAGDGWGLDPFGAEQRDGAVYARGSGDDKADVMARLHALEAWSALRGELPFTVLWLSEGMEEVGSPGLPEVIAAHRDALRADACLWESYYRSIDGHAATIGFGSRGVLNVELSVRLLPADTHSGMAGVYRSATAVLIQAIASLLDRDGRVQIPGFYEDVVAFSNEDEALVAASPAAPGVLDPHSPGALWSGDDRVLTRRWLYEPTLNLASVHAGPHGGEHEATVLPASARARLDMRLMPNQDPYRILDGLRDHLQRGGFPEVEIDLRNAIPPARSALNTPLADAVRQASRELFGGAEPVSHAVVPGSGPLHLFAGGLDLATVMPPGTIRPDSGMHGPDENARVSDYLDEVKLTLRTLELLAERRDFKQIRRPE